MGYNVLSCTVLSQFNPSLSIRRKKQILRLKPFQNTHKPLAKARGYYKTSFYFSNAYFYLTKL